MKLNKKYQPNNLTQLGKNNKKDWIYPIFLPLVTKFSEEEQKSFYYQELMARNLLQFTGKNYQPLIIKNLHNLDFSVALKGKEKLPFFAQYERLQRLGQKNQKKTEQYLKKLFFDANLEGLTFGREYIRGVNSVFSLLSEKKLLKKAPQLVYRDISNQSIVNTDDIEWRTESQVVLEMKCFVETKNEVLTLIVDDIMSFFSDVGVIVHSNDKRYKKHIGKKIILPMINKSIPIFGESTIDTVTDNWIFRINPLLSPAHLIKAQEYKLPIDDNFVDESGHFLQNVATFAGQSLFDFTENIIETLDTIGNLASKSEKLQQVPYSKITGQRLIKKVIPLWVLDYSSEYEKFIDWVHNTAPKLESLVLSSGQKVLPIEAKDYFWWHLAGDSLTEKISFARPDFLGSYENAYEYLLVALILNHWIASDFSVSDLIDTLYLLPVEMREYLIDIESEPLKKQVESLLEYTLNTEPEIAIENWISELKKLQRVEYDAKTEKAKILISKTPFSGRDTKWTIDEQFLRSAILAILCKEKSESLVLFSPYAENFTKTFLFLSYVFDQEAKPIVISEIQALRYQYPIPEKAELFAKEYGQDALRLAIAQQQKIEEPVLQLNFEYLNHLRNLFRLLYEKEAFHIEEISQLEPIELWIYSEREELLEEYYRYQSSGVGLEHLIQKIQAFSKGQFSRYLEFVKKQKKAEAYWVAGQIFVQILQVLMPYVPEFVAQIEGILTEQLPKHLQKSLHQWKKDYKLHLLFDIIKWITQQKALIKLKKHQPIHLAVKANQDILRLIEQHQEVFHTLFKVDDIQMVELNAHLPSGFSCFSILEIEIWIKSSEEQVVGDDLVILEKLYKSKIQQAEYLRSTLMMLSTNPLIAQEKVKEKQKELELLKDEIDTLDIKIKKIKMQRRA